MDGEIYKSKRADQFLISPFEVDGIMVSAPGI